MNRLWLVMVVLVLALAGCPFSREARAEPVESTLDQAFVLPGGQQATISGVDLRLRFTDVLEDSRCPKKVSCFWTGQARIAILVQQGQGEPTTVEFNTNPAPGQTRLTVNVDEYVIVLQSLDPYPETPDESIPLEDYRATLLVRKAN